AARSPAPEHDGSVDRSDAVVADIDLRTVTIRPSAAVERYDQLVLPAQPANRVGCDTVGVAAVDGDARTGRIRLYEDTAGPRTDAVVAARRGKKREQQQNGG